MGISVSFLGALTDDALFSLVVSDTTGNTSDGSPCACAGKESGDAFAREGRVGERVLRGVSWQNSFCRQMCLAHLDLGIGRVVVRERIVRVRVLVEDHSMRDLVPEFAGDTDMAFRAVPAGYVRIRCCYWFDAGTLSVDRVYSRCFGTVVSAVTPPSLDIGQYTSTHGVLTITAPRARSMTSFSRLILAGRVMMHWYPLMAQASASPIPVLPLVGSITTL